MPFLLSDCCVTQKIDVAEVQQFNNNRRRDAVVAQWMKLAMAATILARASLSESGSSALDGYRSLQEGKERKAKNEEMRDGNALQ